MAQKLGIPFTQDLIALGTNAAISDALIEKAVAAGKSESQINEAMAALWMLICKLKLVKSGFYLSLKIIRPSSLALFIYSFI